MPRYVALFRGINVGKAKRIAMADLRALLETLGYRDVQTLLNSGNAVFTGDAASPNKHAVRIRAAVAKQLGVNALVIVKSGKDISAIIDGNRLARVATDPARLLVAMSGDSKALAALAPHASRDWGTEQVHLGRHAAYVWCADGILASAALAPLLKSLGTGGTTRNWSTLNRIHALMRPVDRR
jgi:uncharacterized protein (DUF1697 family)